MSVHHSSHSLKSSTIPAPIYSQQCRSCLPVPWTFPSSLGVEKLCFPICSPSLCCYVNENSRLSVLL